LKNEKKMNSNISCTGPLKPPQLHLGACPKGEKVSKERDIERSATRGIIGKEWVVIVWQKPGAWCGRRIDRQQKGIISFDMQQSRS
jgi:hypothetical protein